VDEIRRTQAQAEAQAQAKAEAQERALEEEQEKERRRVDEIRKARDLQRAKEQEEAKSAQAEAEHEEAQAQAAAEAVLARQRRGKLDDWRREQATRVQRTLLLAWAVVAEEVGDQRRYMLTDHPPREHPHHDASHAMFQYHNRSITITVSTPF
jgi:hypothetical protein